MRKLIHFSFIVLLFAGCHSNKQGQSQNAGDAPLAVASEGGPVIKFDTIYFDLGSLDINGPNQTRDFLFTNTGGEPLVIDSVESSCSCLDIDYPKTSIASGNRSKITMTLKVNELSSGQFYRSAFVYSNASDEPTEIILQGIKNYE